VAQLAEVLGSEPIERRPVELCGTAHRVVNARLERLVLGVVPGLLGHVPVLDEDFLGVPVLGLSRQPIAALENQDPLPGRRQVPGKRAPAGAAADDDDVDRPSLDMIPLLC
jgi:hypothetical protein